MRCFIAIQIFVRAFTMMIIKNSQSSSQSVLAVYELKILPTLYDLPA
jgi:hypothetical protein